VKIEESTLQIVPAGADAKEKKASRKKESE